MYIYIYTLFSAQLIDVSKKLEAFPYKITCPNKSMHTVTKTVNIETSSSVCKYVHTYIHMYVRTSV